ncbi:hypothetical protein [Cryobacterium sp. N22]|uniref:hypothetical protein n=1 Tax=Cryobacterium sp. N22 TaxID=2048290 RepID=UPI001304995B|nr:hypothetical protein [Cryobacterium sp. N22]
MTTQNTPTSFRQNRTVGLLGASLVVALLVGGCSSPQPEATKEATTPAASATPTPTAVVGGVEEPLSEEHAIAGATLAAEAYFALRTEIEVEHPTDPSVIDTVATGAAAEHVRTFALNLVENGTTNKGAYAYDVTESSYAGASEGSDGTVYPFGLAQLVGCFDSSGITATNADGSPGAMSATRRGILNLTVLYYASEKAWLVQDVQAPAENVMC